MKQSFFFLFAEHVYSERRRIAFILRWVIHLLAEHPRSIGDALEIRWNNQVLTLTMLDIAFYSNEVYSCARIELRSFEFLTIMETRLLSG